MALETFNVLSELSQAMRGESCLPKAPFMKLGDGTQAPILNYSLEQKSSFTAYGHFLANIPDGSFKAATANAIPAGNMFDRVAAMTIDEVKEWLKNDLKRQNGTIFKALASVNGGVVC
jgi:hypothetical protein